MLPLPRLQDGEAGEHRLDVDPHRGSVAAPERPHFQVLPHRHAREQPLAFRHVDQTALQTLAGGDRIDPLAVETHLTRGQRRQPGNGSQARGLARAVGADQGDGLTAVDRQRNAMQHTRRSRTRRTMSRTSSSIFVVRHAKIGLDHRRVPCHLPGRALGDLAAELQHADAVADIHHGADVVLDQNNGDRPADRAGCAPAPSCGRRPRGSCRRPVRPAAAAEASAPGRSPPAGCVCSHAKGWPPVRSRVLPARRTRGFRARGHAGRRCAAAYEGRSSSPAQKPALAWMCRPTSTFLKHRELGKQVRVLKCPHQSAPHQRMHRQRR